MIQEKAILRAQRLQEMKVLKVEEEKKKEE